MKPLSVPSLPLSLSVGALLVTAFACSPSVQPVPPPPGTVLIVDEHPIQADEVDRVGGWIAAIEPASTPLHLRRLALTNVVFPRLAARGLSNDAWRAAQAEAEARLERLKAGDAEAELGREEHSGSWQELGLESFGAALEAGPDRWSPVFESVGAFNTVRLDRSSDDGTSITIQRIAFPYLPPEKAGEIEAALDRALLTIVDEGWREAVPLFWIHRMQGVTQ